jgi:alpha-tubulin suppressor-like RCC1 family protein
LFTSPDIANVLKCFNNPPGSLGVCNGNGECIAHNLCLCNANYTGFECQTPITYCYGYSSQHFATCSGHGTCNSTDNCVCSLNYVGPTCQFPVCFGLNSTDPLVCSGQGTCTGPNSCLCNDDHFGTNCLFPTVSKVYGSGANSNYMLGVGSGQSLFYQRTIIANFKSHNIIQIECSNTVCFGLTSDFVLLGAGFNSDGELGLNDTSPRILFTTLSSFNGLQVIRISCGGKTCFFLTLNQTWYGTGNKIILNLGNNQFGTLGNNDAYQNQKTPLSLTIINSLGLERIECGIFEFAIGYNKARNLMYSWGRNDVSFILISVVQFGFG